MKKFFLFLAMILSVFSSSVVGVAAADVQTSTSDKITVLPAKFELWATRGEELNQSLKIVNNDDADYIYAMSVDSISTTGENGEIEIGVGNPNLSNLLSSWITTDQRSGLLQAKKTKIINFKIKIPDQIDAGGKYASIVISMDKTERATGESTGVAKVVSLLMVTIAGDFEENTKVLSFKSDKVDKSNDIVFDLRLRNQGANHEKPQGSIVISDIFGRKVDELSVEADNVLPGSTRDMKTVWKPKGKLFGPYTATYIASYGQKNNLPLSASIPFSVFPLGLTTLAVLILISVIATIIWAIKNLLGKKRRR